MERVLVTGGGGFIGSYVLEKLRDLDIRTSVLDRRQREYATDHIDVYLGDIRDGEAVTDAIAQHDGVIHLAGILGTQETMENPRLAVDINIMGALNVFEACRKHARRAAFISVGNYWMNNPYAITKSIAERFALMYNKELGTKIAIVRGFNIYGPRQKAKPVRKVVPTFVQSALQGEDVTIYGSGNQIMDMIYVEDAAEILVRALLMDHGCYDGILEAGMGRDTTINELAEVVIRTCGSQSKVNHIQMRPGENPDSVVKANVETLRCLDLTQGSMTSLDLGIEKTVEWHRLQSASVPKRSEAQA